MSRNYPLNEILLPMGGTTVKDEKKMEQIWESNEYIAEVKWDGSRYLSIGGRFFSRRVSVKDGFPVEKTVNVPHLSNILSKYPLLILDGEIYIEGGKSNEVVSIMGANREKALWRQGFGEYVPPSPGASKGKWRLNELENWYDVPKKEVEELSKTTERKPVKYIVYDILRDLDGKWLLDMTWFERRKELEKVVDKIFSENVNEHIIISEYVIDNKKEFCASVIQQGGEGVMLKNIFGKYRPGKKPSWNWIKVKHEITSDVIITGFKDPVVEYTGTELGTWLYWFNERTREFHLRQPNTPIEELQNKGFIPVTKYFFYGWIGAVEFSQYDKKGELKQVGYCSGLTDELRKEMSENPDKFLGECMEISAMERTKDGFFRHPQFRRMRPDKNPEDCVIGVD